MKSTVRFLLLLLAGVLLVYSVGALPAHAEARDEVVRDSQIRLSNLGYYHGFLDGRMGTQTRTAIRNFQSFNHLPHTGRLTHETYDLLVTMSNHQNPGATLSHSSKDIVSPYAGNSLKHPGSVQDIDGQPAPDADATTTEETWHFVTTENIPVRYGNLSVDEDAKGTSHRFTILMNGHHFLRADNQPSQLQISKVFNLKDEDAVIVTAWRGEETCRYKNFLIIVHSNGTSASHHEFESCAETSEVHEAFGALFVRFASTMNKDGYATWDVWRYENSKLLRL